MQNEYCIFSKTGASCGKHTHADTREQRECCCAGRAVAGGVKLPAAHPSFTLHYPALTQSGAVCPQHAVTLLGWSETGSALEAAS